MPPSRIGDVQSLIQDIASIPQDITTTVDNVQADIAAVKGYMVISLLLLVYIAVKAK